MNKAPIAYFTAFLFYFFSPSVVHAGTAIEPEISSPINTSSSLVTANKNINLKIGGRVFADANWYEKTPYTTFGNRAQIRSARLYMNAMIREKWKGRIQIEFSGNQVSLQDIYIAYMPSDSLQFLIGNYEEPMGLESLASPKYIPFIENPISNAFNPGRHIGAGIKYYPGSWMLNMGVFGGKVTDGNQGDSGMDIAGRLTWLPYEDSNGLIHVGGSVVYSLPGRLKTHSYSRNTESNMADALLNTQTISNVSSYVTANAEVAFTRGPVSL